MSTKEMLDFIEKAYKEGNMPVWDYEKYKEEFKEEFKSAREMFEELGYELIQNDMNWVVYTINKGKWFQFDISFFKQDKSVHLNTKETTFGHSFDMKELKAINKQVEELHWND